MQFEFNWNVFKRVPAEGFLALTHRRIPVVYVRNPRARRYVLRLGPDGSARVTIPRRGSAAEARRFAERNVAWVERAIQRQATRPIRPQEWTVGTQIYFRGELVTIAAALTGGSGHVQVGPESVAVPEAGHLRPAIERHLRRLAAMEFPPRVFALARAQQLTVRRVTVRDQRSRWGSCSRKGTVSLNWRLIQAPPCVLDYLILHELMHLREMNHSHRFWRQVERVCPDYKTAERWLKQHSNLLR